MIGADILHALLDKYGERDPRQGGQWACFPELARSTGGADRYCDLFVVGLWRSNARAIAYEIKVSRSDFQREIDDPTKRAVWEPLASECFFATPAGLVKPDEVPEGWGLIVLGEGGLRVIKKAQQRVPPPWPFDFAQAIARRSADPPPVFPRAAMVELNTGRRLDLPALRRLCHKLWPQVAPKAMQDQRFAHLLQRPDVVLLGAIKRTLENHFRQRVESVAQLHTLLRKTAPAFTHDPQRAHVLRELADLLDPKEAP